MFEVTAMPSSRPQCESPSETLWRQDGKTARLRGCQWCERGKMKKNAERLSNSLSGNYPHHLQTMTPSKARSRDSSPPHDSHDFSIISMRVFTETMCHPQVLPNLTQIYQKFWMFILKYLFISSVHHLAQYGISWRLFDELLHLPEAMSCSVPPQGAFEEEAAIVGSPIVEAPMDGVESLKGCLMAPFPIHLAPIGGSCYVFILYRYMIWYVYLRVFPVPHDLEKWENIGNSTPSNASCPWQGRVGERTDSDLVYEESKNGRQHTIRLCSIYWY